MKPVLLCILDGFGNGNDSKGNAVKLANTPNLDMLTKKYPNTTLKTSGLAVGLPDGQMGNSEVGHLNIGAGRVVKQALVRIDEAVAEDKLIENEAISQLVNKDTVHIIGLLSDGGVHAHINHIKGLISTFKGKTVYIHAITDGRDVAPDCTKKYFDEIKPLLNDKVKFASVSGRYYAMDRDKRWERLLPAYNAIVKGEGKSISDINAYIDEEYKNGIQDEFINPVIIDDFAGIKPEDGILFANFRPDRMIQICATLTNKDYETSKDSNLKTIPNEIVTLTDYGSLVKAHVAYGAKQIENSYGEIVSNNNMKQLRIAETEKYPHVTYFLNGGKEDPFKNEDRILIPSPKVATYDLKPEMSANEITTELVKVLDKYDTVILNFANCDMVGHTGDIPAVIKAVETVDNCVGILYNKVKELGGVMLITADHGNAEEMLNEKGEVVTKHSTNPVPLIITKEDIKLNDDCALCDLAPTMLSLLNINKPEEMTGKNIIK